MFYRTLSWCNRKSIKNVVEILTIYLDLGVRKKKIAGWEEDNATVQTKEQLVLDRIPPKQLVLSYLLSHVISYKSYRVGFALCRERRRGSLREEESREQNQEPVQDAASEKQDFHMHYIYKYIYFL